MSGTAADAYYTSPQVISIMLNLPSVAKWWSSSHDPEPQWLIRPLIAKGEVTLLKGPPKDAGKTTFLLHAVKAMVRGTEFLGQTVVPLPVLYATEETTTFRMAARQTGISEADRRFRPLDRQGLRGAEWNALLGCLYHVSRGMGAELIVIDTLAHFARMDEGEEHDAGVVTGRIKALQQLADATGAAVVVVCHDRKPGGGGSHLTKARGSNALVASVDRIVSLDRVKGTANSNVRVLNVTGRVSGQQRLLVELTQSGYVLIEGTAEKSPGKAAGDVGGARRTRGGTRPRLTLPTHEARAMTVQELMMKYKRSDSSIRRDLGRIAGVRTISGKGKGDPHRYYVDGGE